MSGMQYREGLSSRSEGWGYLSAEAEGLRLLEGWNGAEDRMEKRKL